jgi:hypothetical protein
MGSLAVLTPARAAFRILTNAPSLMSTPNRSRISADNRSNPTRCVNLG